jgi:2-polyprenyl-6-methoxyphenol hydroxylase-like FAD-dependent oxidoreductase
MNPPPRSRPLRRATGLRIAVVGGSLTGPVAALLLRNADFEVTLFEAVPDSAPQGGGLIGLEHSALDILDRLGISQNEFIAYASETVTEITVCRRCPGDMRQHRYPGRNTTWPLLHTALARRLPDAARHTGIRITGLHERHGQPVLSAADGTEHPADLIVFADGRTSTGRRLLDPGRRLRYAGYVAHRGHGDPLPGLADFTRLVPDPNPGMQFNCAPVPGGTDWTFYLPATSEQYRDYFGAALERRVFALPQHVNPTARDAVDQAAARHLPNEQAGLVHASATRTAAAVVDIDPPTRMVWPIGAGHAVLLGDALAPVRPHTARGANNGIEQAAGLAAALTQHRKYGADLVTALDGWQHRHLPAAVAAVELGPVLGRRSHLGPAA